MSRHKKVVFPNGQVSLEEPLQAQSMHSRIGPWSEANLLYVDQLGVVEALKNCQNSLVFYDVGMGTAANAIAALEKRKEISSPASLDIVSFETDLDGIRTAMEHVQDFPFLKPWMEKLETLLRRREAQGEGWTWTLHEGPFQENWAKCPQPDRIAYDFYDPKVFPDLWTLDGFRRLRAFLGDHPCLLSTYSAATPVRMGLVLAGFHVGYGMTTGAKAETTLASTDPALIQKPLGVEWIEKLKRSTRAEPYRDPGAPDSSVGADWIKRCEEKILA
ncbi:MAG: hypothetical protein JNL01_03260 [Bdellovibrionales bacterium]|nr:hypothetical protein [Bdellovibrionales bacterium]